MRNVTKKTKCENFVRNLRKKKKEKNVPGQFHAIVCKKPS